MPIFRRKRRDDEIRVELTALIDLVFLLLIFFIVSTTFISSPGIQVNLPRSSFVEVRRDRKDITVTLTKQGDLYIDRQKIDWPALRPALETASRGAPDVLVIVEADEAVSHGRVVEVLDAVKGSGLNRIAISTVVQRAEGPP